MSSKNKVSTITDNQIAWGFYQSHCSGDTWTSTFYVCEIGAFLGEKKAPTCYFVDSPVENERTFLLYSEDQEKLVQEVIDIYEDLRYEGVGPTTPSELFASLEEDFPVFSLGEYYKNLVRLTWKLQSVLDGFDSPYRDPYNPSAKHPRPGFTP
jgi:hypothetical protein